MEATIAHYTSRISAEKGPARHAHQHRQWVSRWGDAREAPVRANREVSILGKIYRFAIKWRAATKNPVLGFIYDEEKPRAT